VKDLAFFILRFFAKEAQNDRGCGLVILNAVKDLVFFILIFFAKEAQNDRGSRLVILRNEGSCTVYP